MPTAALIVAAGRGDRFGAQVPKQYAQLGGMALLRRTVLVFLHHPSVDQVRVVIGPRPEDRALYEAAVAGLDLMTPVPGGETRQESVRLGLESLADSPPERVLVHDAARPFADSGLIGRVLDALATVDGAIPAVPVVDSLKKSNDDLVTEDVAREGLCHAQTPQAFRFAGILAAHKEMAAAEAVFTDDASIARAHGLSVRIVEGSTNNFKITTPDDLARAERHLMSGLRDVRFGQGFDVHRLEPGTHVTLCGVDIPHDAGLSGHSDADVALHALTDALLGAIGDGDIGYHFPPSDEKWRGAPSSIFVEHAAELIRRRGGAIGHVDVTIICEAPKIGPHREAMRHRIAELLVIDVSRVSVKATTTEGLGLTGRREGIAAQAVATVRLPE
jgi:2-C-methyl-D-erythritol 4-phosphate cytidylyltransferase/2-C-methyl-D-erythritol 2,4-cyclodiphosphate synthase